MKKHLRKLMNTVLGIDGKMINKELEDIYWGLRFQSLTMGSDWYRGGCTPEDGR